MKHFQVTIENLPLDWRHVFAHRVIATTERGCWILKTSGPKRYPSVNFGGRTYRGNRLSWMLAFGPIPAGEGSHGTCVCHHCDVRACINPSHLFLGSHTDNMRDMESKGRGRHPAGDEQGLRKHPEARAWGARNGSRTKPEVRPRGEGHANRQLNDNIIREMRRLYPDVNTVQLAAMFGTSQRNAWLIVNHKAWRHVQ